MPLEDEMICPFVLAFAAVLTGSSPVSPQTASARLLAEIVAQRERTFAQRALQINPREAFLEFFSPDAVMFSPRPVPAHERLRRPAPWPFTLEWWPLEVTISRNGTLACSTGPAIRTPSGTGKPTYGTYFSIWRPDQSGGWMVSADLGTDTPCLWAEQEAPTRFHLPESSAPNTPDPDLEQVRRAFLEQSSRNLPQALESFSGRHHLLFLPETRPLSSPGERTAHLRPEPAIWETLGSIQDAADDMAVFWGTGRGGYQAGSYSFLRVWRLDSGKKWRIHAEVIVPSET